MFDRIDQGIYWDRAWTLISGCTPCSPGCTHCWALGMEKRFTKCYDGIYEGRIRIHPERLEIPLKRKKPIVWAIWNDLFHEDIPQTFIDGAWDIMRRADKHIFLILTKRIKRAEEFCRFKQAYSNIWPGVTVCNQEEADEKIPLLRRISATVRFISGEPLLEQTDLCLSPGFEISAPYGNRGIHWVIAGGETGPRARPMHPEWVRSVRDQCQAAGVPFFFKRHGSWNERYYKASRFDPTNSGRLMDGREYNELPEIK